MREEVLNAIDLRNRQSSLIITSQQFKLQISEFQTVTNMKTLGRKWTIYKWSTSIPMKGHEAASKSSSHLKLWIKTFGQRMSKCMRQDLHEVNIGYACMYKKKTKVEWVLIRFYRITIPASWEIKTWKLSIWLHKMFGFADYSVNS